MLDEDEDGDTIVAMPFARTPPGHPVPGRRVLALVASALLTVVAWTSLAPVAVGGPTAYVVTQGTSMLPNFEADGLVVTRTQQDYRTGDVVAYRNRELKAVVMHRIIRRDGERYVLQGDNNDFLDTYRPTRGEVIGRQWLHWPGGGRWFRLVRTPMTFAVVLAVLGAVASTAFATPISRRRRRHHA